VIVEAGSFIGQKASTCLSCRPRLNWSDAKM